MKPTVLIHGYGIGVKTVFMSPKGIDCGFEAFNSSIENGTAYAFDWRSSYELPGIAGLSPFAHIKIYTEERKRIYTSSIQKDLHTYLKKHKTEMVICHSLGCQLLLNTITSQGLLPSIRTIILVQADITHDETLPSSLLARLATDDISIFNYFCPWDQALIGSSILHKSLRAGLVGLKGSDIRNHFFPLYKRLNLHTSSVCDTHFRNRILSHGYSHTTSQTS